MVGMLFVDLLPSGVDVEQVLFVEALSLLYRCVVENDLMSLLLAVIDIERANVGPEPPAPPARRCSGTPLPSLPRIPSARTGTQTTSTTLLIPPFSLLLLTPSATDYPPIMTMLLFFIPFKTSIPACFAALLPTAIPINARRSASSSDRVTGRRRRERRDTSALSNRQTWVERLDV